MNLEQIYERHADFVWRTLRRLGVVPHGRFSRVGIGQAIVLAARGVDGDLVSQTHAALEAAGALRRGPLAASGAGTTVSAP